MPHISFFDWLDHLPRAILPSSKVSVETSHFNFPVFVL